MHRTDITQAQLDRFRTLFRGNESAHGTYKYDPNDAERKEVKTRKGPATDAAFRRHLEGRGAGLGIVPIREDGLCYWGAIDIDDDKTDHQALAAVVVALRLPLVVCRSKSGGAHLILFLVDPAPAKLIREKLNDCKAALNIAKNHDGRPVEVFPKQDTLRKGESGNWLNLPYYGGDTTIRYTVDDAGQHLSLTEFLSYAEAKRISSLELEAFHPEGGNPFRHGPPCLETLHDVGFPEGSRNQGMYNVGVFLKMAPPDDWRDRLAAYNDEKCAPPLRPAELTQLTRSLEKRDYTYKCSDIPIVDHCQKGKCKKREYGIRASTDAAAAKETDTIVQELNQQYGIVQVGGKAYVLQDRGVTFELLRTADFRLLHLNRTVGRKTVADAWLTHPDRRTFDDGVVFAPPGEPMPPKSFNIFRGWGVEPRAGDCSLFLHHVRDNVCQRDDALYQWVMGWFAWIFQHPTQKLGTSLALRGQQGTGKSIVGEIFGRLLGRHWVQVDDPHYVTGHFNSHLEHCLLLQAEEAFWAGNKAAEGRLKNLITSGVHLIERKGIDSYPMPNYVRLFTTSNAEWVVPAAFEERRFAVLDVSDARRQDFKYFGAIRQQMENEAGYAALMAHVQSMELDESTLRTIPNTSALRDQKRQSEPPEYAWLRAVLQDGTLPGDGDGHGESPSKAMHASYIAYARVHNISRRLSEDSLGRFIKRVFPHVEKARASAGNVRLWMRRFPPLSECREQFDTFTGQLTEWDEADGWGRYDVDASWQPGTEF